MSPDLAHVNVPVVSAGAYRSGEQIGDLNHGGVMEVEFERIRKALRTLVLEHNGWIDPDSDELRSVAEWLLAHCAYA